MRYSIAGCVLMLLMKLSASMAAIQIQQNPRFYCVRMGRTVSIYCMISGASSESLKVKWYKAKTHSDPKRERHVTPENSVKINITNVKLEDNGVYYCEVNGNMGHGTELQVLRLSKSKEAARRSKMKDFIIFLQAFLLVLCIVLPLLWHYRLGKKEEAVYEEPERDHTYEGLEIEHCGGDLYEDIRAFADVSQGPEAAWEVEAVEGDAPEIEFPEE
ncbi:B-cell antigen receptor complex-associated protein beta chain [Astyanax mexicanus]|uniref:B-cell antigen receptor complex-associated protein beta chain n=2 Tax=Astyanax mexicanus TaxID=7994 RepID=A0A8T2L9G6_ASTMX|nr:B-cell antigen receptor complex-associated protein beta chain [Astyanax mexicanus]KAG9267427.1 B-cell antigen receptor complex-associated protein beta chain [Astyanax mexicanus]